MITEHIQRYMAMTDDEFIYHAQFYRHFRNMTRFDHTHNIDYISDRCNKLGYTFSQGCCNRFHVTKNDIQK